MRSITAEQFGALALPVGEFLARGHRVREGGRSLKGRWVIGKLCLTASSWPAGERRRGVGWPVVGIGRQGDLKGRRMGPAGGIS